MNGIHYEEPDASNNNNRETIIRLILRLSRPPHFSFACSSSELRLPSYTRLISRTNSPPSLSVAVRPYRKQRARARARGVLLIQYSQWLRLALSFVPLITISLCSPVTLPELSLARLLGVFSFSLPTTLSAALLGICCALKKSWESGKWSNIDSWEGGREGAATSDADMVVSRRQTSVRPSVRPDSCEGWVRSLTWHLYVAIDVRVMLKNVWI